MQPPGANQSAPLAFLTILFFDERFNFIEAADGGVAQQQVLDRMESGSDGEILGLLNIKAPKNGYAFIYISSESEDDVYFDNLQVGITAGHIIEENHYYSYGLKIATISSRKFPHSSEGGIKNNYLYNGKELFDDADLNWYDYGFRNYDPQIGRFTQLDPLTFEYSFLTPYQYASCEPIANVDVDGLEAAKVIDGAARIGQSGKVLGYVGDAVVTAQSILSEVVVAAGPSLIKAATKEVVLTVAQKVSIAASVTDLINTSFITQQRTNVAESVNQNSGGYLRPEPKPYQPPTIGPCTVCDDDAPTQKNPNHDPYVSMIRQETVDKLSNRPGDAILGWGGIKSLIVAGRMEVNGFHDEAGDALRDAPGEMVMMVLPVTKIIKKIPIPTGWITKTSKRGGGTIFQHPTNPHNSIRTMPGNPNSPWPSQQVPYVKFMKDGKFYDVNGNPLANGSLPEAHIPFEKFNINVMPKF